MEGHGLQSTVFGEAGHLRGDDLALVPTGAAFHGKRDGDGLADGSQEALHQGQIAQQTGPAVALDHLVDGAAEVDIDDVEPEVLANARGIRHDVGIGAEELRGDGAFLAFEFQVAQCAGGLARAERSADAVGAGELRHEQAAPAQIADEAPEYGVRDACHGGQHGGGGDPHRADGEAAGEERHIEDRGQTGESACPLLNSSAVGPVVLRRHVTGHDRRWPDLLRNGGAGAGVRRL